MINNITVDYLKELYLTKYSDEVFFNPVTVLEVTLTLDQFRGLNDDLMRSINKDPVSLVIDEEDIEDIDPEKILFTRIVLPKLCEFIVHIGEEFTFTLLNESEGYGEETLECI